MVLMRRVALALLAIPCAAFTCGPAPDPLPAADVCDTPVAPDLPFTVELAGHTGAFAPWSDGAGVRTVLGGQGSDMLAVRVRVVGDDVPACIGLTVRVTIDGVVAGMRGGAIATYPDGPGRTTEPLYIELFNNQPGDDATVEATVGAVTTTRAVVLDP
jgi:hypothetical protein